MSRACFLLVLCCSLGSATSACAQAFFALRDPPRSIHETWPTATSFKSIVRTMTDDIRNGVASELPFPIRFNQLGRRNTLYFPMRDGQPLGLVHARSETAKRGFIEIIWSLDPRLRIREFSFQRCWPRAGAELEKEPFQKQIIGRNLNEMRALVTNNGQSLAAGQLQYPRGAEELVLTVVKSGIKTLAVTKVGWKTELQEMRRSYETLTAFPTLNEVRRIQSPYRSDVVKAIDQALPAESVLDRNSVVVTRAINQRGEILGHVIKTRIGRTTDDLWWIINPNRTIKDVIPDPTWADSTTQTAYESTKALSIQDLENCSTTAELTAAEVLVLASQPFENHPGAP